MFGRVTNVLRQSAPRLSASYSSQAPSRLTGVATLQGLVEQAALKQAQEPEVSGPSIRVQPLRLGSVVRPHQLTYNNRVGNSVRTKRPSVAPASKQARSNDIFYQLNIDPVSIATNSSILREYVTEMGQIKPRTLTGLTVKTQRRLGKAIRRARMMGVIPLLSKTREF